MSSIRSRAITLVVLTFLVCANSSRIHAFSVQRLMTVTAGRSVLSRPVYFVPIGGVPASVVDTLQVQCQRKLNIPIETLPRIGFDHAWVDRQRDQAVAERVAATLRQRYPGQARSDAVLIGIMDDDMYIAHLDWRFAFGYRLGGSSGQRVGVISVARMKPEFYNEPPNEALFMERLRKMVVRYIGVLHLELPFNVQPTSVLYRDLLGVDDLDRMGEDLPRGPLR